MPTVTVYPVSANGYTDFTNISNVVGNTTSTATNTSAANNDAVLYGMLQFDMTASIPAGSIITGLTYKVIARASATSRRAFYQVVLYRSNRSSHVTTGETLLGTSYTTCSIVIDVEALKAKGYTDAEIMSTTTDWDNVFVSRSSTSTTTTWQKAFIDVTYELPPSSNALFFGENF